MAHNPIINTKNKGIVDINQVGVFYKNKKFVKILDSGESPGFLDSYFSNTEIFIVDIAPHIYKWRVSIPSKNTKDQFSLSVDLTYKVANAKKMIEDNVKDTEQIINRELDNLLRIAGKEFPFNEYQKAEDKFIQVLKNLDLSATTGLQFTNEPTVQIYLDEDDYKRIKFLDEVERSKKIPRQIEYKAQIPSNDQVKNFAVTVAIDYRVVNEDELPSDNLDDAVKYLWPRIERAIKKGARNYPLSDINGADTAMQDQVSYLFDRHELSDFGIDVLLVNITTDIAEEERKKYREIDDTRHKNLVKKEELSIAEDLRKLLTQNKFDALVVAVNNGEIEMKELYKIMDQAQKDQFDLQMKLVDKISDKELNPDVADIVVSRVADSVTEPSSGIEDEKLIKKQLISGNTDQQQLPAKEETTAEEEPDE